MKLWKRGIAVLLLLSVLLAQTFALAESISDESLKNFDRLLAFGIASGTLAEEDAPVSRGRMVDFVCRAANITVDAREPMGELYADVPKDHAYANAIEAANGLGVISNAELFYPDRQITLDEAVVMIIHAMGYQKIAASQGGYPQGYQSLAARLSITKGVHTERLTLDSAIKLISNMLDSDVMDISFSEGKLSYTIDEEQTFLEKVFDVVKYEAAIDEIDTANEKITFTVKGQKNTQYTYPYSKNAGAEKAGGEVVIYLDNKDDTVAFIETKRGSEVFNDFIYEINRSEDSQALNKESLKYVEFKNKNQRYRVSDELYLTYNDTVITMESYDYVNCFAKVVIQDNEVIRMDLYQLSEGGLIYFADDNELGYTRGEDYENYYKGFQNAKDLQIYIDGVFTNKMTDLKTDMVYDFWYNGKDKYILVASSRSKTGVLDGYPEDQLEIDGEAYDISKQYGWYNFEALYNTYRPGNAKELLGETVTVFFDDNKEIRYVRKDIAKSEKKTFPAFVIKTFIDEDEDREMVRLYRADIQETVTYTGMTIGEDPALLFCALENETSIFFAANFDQWDYYYPKMNELYNQWLLEKYPTRAALSAAWTMPESDNAGLYSEEDQTKGTVKLRTMANLRDINSKRINDNVQFLAHLQTESMNKRFAEVRKWAPHAILQGSTAFTYGYGDRANQYTLAKNGDFYSMQAYFFLAIGNGEHMVPGTKTIADPKSILSDSSLNNLGLFASCKVFDQLYFLTEWDNGMPNPFRSEITLLMGAFSAFQNWSPYLFCWDPTCVYSKRVNKKETEKIPDNQHSLMDRPDMINVLPIVAQMVLRGDVTKAEQGYFFNRYQNDEVFDGSNQSMLGDSAWAWCGKSGYFVDDIAYDADYNNNDIFKLKRYGDETGKYVSYTDEMLTDVKEGRYLLNTERTQAAAGKIGSVELDDVSFDIKTPFATVYLASRDENGASIRESERLLLTMVGDSRMIGQVMTDDSVEFLSAGEGPMLLEPIEGTVTIKNYNSYDVYTIGADGRRKQQIPTRKTNEGYTAFQTAAADETINYELVRTEKKSGAAPQKISFLDRSVFDELFTDLGEWEKDREKLERIYMQGFIKPTGEGRFSPNQPITRADAAKAIVDAFGFSAEKAPDFCDVDSTHPYYKYICSAAQYGVIVGDENQNFSPNAPITRQDFVLMVKKALDKSRKKRTEERTRVPKMNFDEIAGYARTAAEEMVRLGYLENEESLRPKEYATRGDLCIILYNILWE